MPLTGSDYLLRLAALSLSMVGFAAIVLTLRRALGGELSGLHMLLVRLFIEDGFAVTVFALLPSALSLTPLASSEIWRLSSAAAGLGFAIYLVSLFRRRRRVLAEPLPRPTAINFAVSTLATVALCLNAVGLPYPPNAATYALTLTWFFVMGVWVFLRNLEGFIQLPPPG